MTDRPIGLCNKTQRNTTHARPVDSHGEARGNILAGPPNIFTGPRWGEHFWIFLFKMIHSGVLYKFLADGRASQTSWGPGLLTLLPHPLDGPEERT